MLKLRSFFKKLNCLASSAFPLFQVKSKTRLNTRILRLNFLSDLAKGQGRRQNFFQGRAIRMERVLTNKNGRTFEICEV